MKNRIVQEDTVKQGSYWVNKGKDGTHGKFKTKKAANAQRAAMFANGYKEGFAGSVKHPEQDKIEQDLLSIPYTKKIEFDYRPGDGIYKVPENHLILLAFIDYEKLNDDTKDSYNLYFSKRREWKNNITRKLFDLGWELEDPIEDDDTYLYYVIKKINPIKEQFSYSSDEYSLIQLDDLISNLVGNLSDKELDKNIRTFNKISRLLGKKKFSEIFVLRSDRGGVYDPTTEYENAEGVSGGEQVGDGLLSQYDAPIKLIREPFSSYVYVYFASEEDAKKYVDFIDKLMADLYDSEEVLTEGTWAIPNREDKIRILASLFTRPIKREDEAILYHVFGDDALFDELDDSEESDLRYVVAEHLKKLINLAEKTPERLNDEFPVQCIEKIKEIIKDYIV